MDKPDTVIDWDSIDWGSVDQATLALMLLGLHDGWRAWKGFDWDVLDRLYQKELITDPRGKARSVVFTERGLEESQRAFERLFGRRSK